MSGFICISAITFHHQVYGSKTAQSTHQITSIIYDGRTAYQLSDGLTEAVVVPEIGRVMRYGFVSGFNFLWNSIQKNFNKNEWRNWGGNKTWAAPQLWWSAMSGRDWPPDEVWDGSPHKTRILSNGHLQTTSEVTSGMGARTVREYWFEKNGDFTIRQTVEKVTGEPLLLSIWNVTQIVSPDAMFVPLNPKSPYKQNFHWITPVNNGSPVVHITPT
ncbi:MAG: hypothetical protein SAK29_18250 [Scytonema sp. PMC 1069.18]|nr:hypothetical protein [Scytonema sp. PMC 1069.18]MEC4883587.1 hypothetical protein [Scytonema sp. PMC 1070.18]